jgi:acyl dehydratase
MRQHEPLRHLARGCGRSYRASRRAYASASRAAALGPTEWIEIGQDRIDGFAAATGDDQWIHVDVERAAQGPFGATIAHGYLTLSLASFFLPQIATYEGFSMAINYGVDKVRFINPVKCGARIRAGAEMQSVTDVGGGVQTKVLITIEIEGEDKPACVIESLSRWFE